MGGWVGRQTDQLAAASEGEVVGGVALAVAELPHVRHRPVGRQGRAGEEAGDGGRVNLVNIYIYIYIYIYILSYTLSIYIYILH